MKAPRAGVLAFATVFSIGSPALAVPVLQVGAPAGPGDAGSYADYEGTPTPPPDESDTAITSGNAILVAGAYARDVVQLGGQFTGDPLPGLNWSDFSRPVEWNRHGAILVVSVPDGTVLDQGSDWMLVAGASLTIAGADPITPFYASQDTSYFPNNHDPVKGTISDFLFYDVGSFLERDPIPNFSEETYGSMLGEIKTLTIGASGLDWIHFDIMALETIETIVDGKKRHATILVATDLENNPGSHDVTWKPPEEPVPVPEPGSVVMLLVGVLGLAGCHRGSRR